MAIDGIDVSAYQPNIDWAKVKASGIQTVIIRAGYGKGNVDKCFKSHIEGALSAGLAVGVYWFIYTLSMDDTLLNAKGFINAIAPYKGKITMKCWCDWEGDTDAYAGRNGVSFTKEQRTAHIRAFNDAVSDAGFEVGLYANPNYLKNYFNDMPEYPLWLALYGTSRADRPCFMWQYTSKGVVDGIKGNVDRNYIYDVIPPIPPAMPTIASPTVRLGSTGANALLLQKNLNRFGYHLTEDGIFGQKSVDALAGWQFATGLSSDGVYGSASEKKMIELLGK